MNPSLDAPDAGIPSSEVERRLEELRALHRLGLALLDVRFVDAPTEVRELPPEPVEW
jgi:hypothetical protein